MTRNVSAMVVRVSALGDVPLFSHCHTEAGVTLASFANALALKSFFVRRSLIRSANPECLTVDNFVIRYPVIFRNCLLETRLTELARELQRCSLSFNVREVLAQNLPILISYQVESNVKYRRAAARETGLPGFASWNPRQLLRRWIMHRRHGVAWSRWASRRAFRRCFFATRPRVGV